MFAHDICLSKIEDLRHSIDLIKQTERSDTTNLSASGGSIFNLQFRLARVRYLSGKLVIVLLLGLASLANAEPTIKISYDYYDIEGRTAAELRHQMNIYGVVWTDGNIYDAYTGWNVKWNYRYRLADDGCSINSVTTTLTVEFRLPRWVNRTGAPAALTAKWDAYLQSLEQHENGHKDFGIQAGIEIERSIAGLDPAVTCDDLAKTANQLGRRILSEYAAKERAYDARTNFGETQGAVFP
jgi:predicted secreted Zn-dependent protease